MDDEDQSTVAAATAAPAATAAEPAAPAATALSADAAEQEVQQALRCLASLDASEQLSGAEALCRLLSELGLEASADAGAHLCATLRAGGAVELLCGLLRGKALGTAPQEEGEQEGQEEEGQEEAQEAAQEESQEEAREEARGGPPPSPVLRQRVLRALGAMCSLETDRAAAESRLP